MQFLGTRHKYPLIANFKKADNRQGFKRFPQADAIRQNTSLMREDFIDDALHPIFLKIKQCIPDLAIKQAGATEVMLNLIIIL